MLTDPLPAAIETLVDAPAVRAVDARKVFGEGTNVPKPTVYEDSSAKG